MTTKICPVCHSPIPAHAPGGLCPACLLRDAEEPPESGQVGLPIDEVATAFPNLEILDKIGQGGMGVVFKARQPALDRIVALKILLPELGRDPAFAERFAREARVLGKLSHPNIVTVFEHGESGGFFYLLMEYVDGVNLRQAMHAGRFTPEQALALVPGICDALQSSHAQGVWHRDIKPENILLDAAGGVKIADFGIARIVGDPLRDFTLTRTGNALGSIAYMAPEQHEKPHQVDHRADIYSLGVVIYEMLTGELPLGRFPAPSRRAEVNARIDEIVLRTLEKERELRHQSATEVKTDVQGAVIKCLPSSREKQVEHPPRKRTPRKSTLLSVLALTASAFFWFSYTQKDLARMAYEESTKQLKLQAINELGSWKTAMLKMNEPGRNYGWGPAMEITIPKPALGVPCMFDFQSGLLFNPPDALGELLGRGHRSFAAPAGSHDRVHVTNSRFDWLLAQGIDAAVTTPDCDSIQLFRSMAFPMTGNFDDITAGDVEQRVRAGVEREEEVGQFLDSFTERQFIPLPSPSSTPFAFISAKSSFGDALLGVMQIIGKQTAPEGVKIRYRLIERLPDTPGGRQSAEAAPSPVVTQRMVLLGDRTNWRITESGPEGESTIDFEGKLKAQVSEGHGVVALSLHVEGNPVFTVIGKGASTYQSDRSNGRGVTGNADLGKHMVDYSIDDGDKATLKGRSYDLTRGRTFLLRPDGSLRQINRRPERVLSGDPLKAFINALPPEP